MTATKKKIALTSIVKLQAALKSRKIHTVCVSARCPNKSECFDRGTATFLILGNVCSRHCRFCSVEKDQVMKPLDIREPERLAEFAKELALRHVVITSVTRDDLADGGGTHFSLTITAVKRLNPSAIVEVLTPDFQLNFAALDSVLAAKPEIFNHNLETVPRLYPLIRPEADYQRSLSVLSYVKEKHKNIFTKSGLMLGLGETEAEVRQVLRDLKKVGCDMVVLGQYFQPTKENIPVTRYLSRDEFTAYQKYALNLGFLSAASEPYMRSSYLAKELYQKITPD